MKGRIAVTNVKIMAILTALPGKTDELRALLDGMASASRAEPGNLRYDIWRDGSVAGRFVLDELYTDVAAVAAHRGSAYFGDYLNRINHLAERTAMTLDAVDVA
jgi:quinol monooxygenase YgiN